MDNKNKRLKASHKIETPKVLTNPSYYQYHLLPLAKNNNAIKSYLKLGKTLSINSGRPLNGSQKHSLKNKENLGLI